MSYIAVILILGPVVCLIFGIHLIATSRRSIGPGPHCGYCSYNLTGSTANRCPECGRLFIEAGIVTSPALSLRKRRLIGIVLIVTPLLLATLGFAATMFYRERAAWQRATAVSDCRQRLPSEHAAVHIGAGSPAETMSGPLRTEPKRA